MLGPSPELNLPGREVKSISGNQLESKVPSVPVPETAPEPHGPHHLPQCSQTASPAHRIQQAHTKNHYYNDHQRHHCDNSPSPLISCLMFPSSNFHFLINKNKNDLCPSSASGVAGVGEGGEPYPRCICGGRFQRDPKCYY